MKISIIFFQQYKIYDNCWKQIQIYNRTNNIWDILVIFNFNRIYTLKPSKYLIIKISRDTDEIKLHWSLLEIVDYNFYWKNCLNFQELMLLFYSVDILLNIAYLLKMTIQFYLSIWDMIKMYCNNKEFCSIKILNIRDKIYPL